MSDTAKAWAIILGAITAISAICTVTSDIPWWGIPATLLAVLAALVAMVAIIWALNQILLGDGWEND